MNRHTLLSIALSATTCVDIYAGSAFLNKDDGQSEKQRPNSGAIAKAPVSTASYVKLKADGNTDGSPYGLSLMGVNDKTVQLRWLSPEPVDGYFDDFEDHSDFEINSAGNIGWQYIDADNELTYTWQACKFRNQGQKMAFIVMNPWETSPAVNENPDYQPYSGKKMLVDFSAVSDQNNDYIISPELNFEQDFQVSFMARSYKIGTNMNAERIRVGYSTTGKRPSDFTYVNDGDYIELPAAWTLIKYNIPKEAKYVTINCVSYNAFMLMLDDLFVGTNKVRPGSASVPAAKPLIGFNIYRNGEKVTDEPIDSLRFTDNVPDYGEFTYTVTAVYADGTESKKSEELNVNVPDIRLLPFEDDFDDWTLHSDKWSTMQNDGEETRWSIDYYEYGLVDPSATYRWSNLTNYDQSLVTRELHTLDRNNTYLRFNLRLRNSEQTNVDYLSVEVSCDGGTNWTEAKTYDNKNGGFEWTICQIPLNSYLTSDLFRIRFRAHGESAQWINYWYVDDVKIWNPKWTTAQMSVSSANGKLTNCNVSMDADHGSVIETTTDANGNVDFNQIEAGNYNVSILKDGYNIYRTTWNIGTESDNVLNVNMTRPSAELSATSITSDMEAEAKITKQFSLKNTGDGPMTWYLKQTPAKFSGNPSCMWSPLTSFSTSGDLQQSVAFDGEYYYTTSSIELGKFWKYDKNGKFIEQFSIPQMYYKLYDITFDGRYFYGSDWSNRLFKLDFDNRRIVDIITVKDASDLKITHCSYDPDRKGFWIGTFTTIGFIDMEGNILSRFASFDSNNSVSVYGSAYDNITPGGPFLWLSDMTAASDNQIDKIQIRQFNLTSRKLTDVKHVLNDAPGYKIGDSSTGQNYVCGLFGSLEIEPGRFTLVGTLNQSPNLVFRYNMAEVDNWLALSPKHGTLQAGETIGINATFDALTAKNGDSFNTSATLLTNPETDAQEITFALNANSESSVPRPLNLTGKAGKASVTLNWTKGNGSATADGYNIYRDNVKVNTTPVKDLTYTDTKLVYGTYIYKVAALYAGGKESAKSDSVVVTVTDGAQYYAPLHLNATISHNKDVTVNWQSPLADNGRRDTMSWANGNHSDQIGLDGGGYFYAGSKWEPTDIVKYRNKKVSSVSVQLVNNCTYLAVRIMKDGEIIYKKQYKGNLTFDGTFTDIPVDEDIVLEPGHTYLFGLQIMNDDGVNPLSIDDGKAVNGKGNLLSTDGVNWFSAAESGIAGNFNIRVNVAPNANGTESEPTGYNVYRNGQIVNSALVTGKSFSETLPETGIYSYAVSSVYADGGESDLSEATSIEAYDITDKISPQHINAAVERNRNVSVRWDLPVKNGQAIPANITTRPVTTDASMPEFVSSFTGEMSSMGVVTDGEYFYTSIYNEDGRIEKYTLNGQFVANYLIDDIEGIRNLAYDGEYLYAADYTNSIHKIDPKDMSLVESISISEYSRHLAFVPTLDGGNGGFEVGDWNTSILVAKNGSKLGTGPTLQAANGTAYYDGRLYAFEQANDANYYTIGIYDLATNTRVGSIDMGQYLEINDIASAQAGGMSSFKDKSGATYLVMALQRRNKPTEFVTIEIGSIKTIAGYNIYRNGEKLNAEPLTRRYFEESLYNEGQYDYTTETVYIDGTTSEKSASACITIAPQGEAKVPANVKAIASSYGYNVLLSFSDADMHKDATTAENFDNLTDGKSALAVNGTAYKSNWKVTSEFAFTGTKALAAEEKQEAFGVINADGMKYLRFAIRNDDDHNGKGTVGVYYSTGGSERSNFIQLQSYTTDEAWQDVCIELPEGTEYVAIAKAANVSKQFVDAVALYKQKPTSNVYGYDIYRNGEKLNDNPVSGISYVDHNLVQGRYEYQVRTITNTSAESELSDKAIINLEYDNGGMAPTNLTAERQSDGTYKLNWMFPSLGEPIYLRWHDGNSYGTAGLPNGGAFYAGVKWFAEDLKGYGSMSLTDVEFYVNQVPEAFFLLVYENNTLVRQQFIPIVKQYSFNTVHLDDPLKIDTGKDLRVVIYVEHNSATVPLGYDHGPARSGRGNLYSTDGSTWTTMDDDDTDIDANWCISIGLSAYSQEPLERTAQACNATSRSTLRKFTSKNTVQGVLHGTRLDVPRMAAATNATMTSEKNVFEGYNIYRNGDKLNVETMFDTTYVDEKPYSDKYLEYQVAAVYSVHGEKFSNKVTLMTSGINGEAQSNGIRIKAANGELQVYGAPMGSTISVYSIDGSLVSSTVAKDSFVQNVSLNQNAQGTYIIKVADRTFKLKISEEKR